MQMRTILQGNLQGLTGLSNLNEVPISHGNNAAATSAVGQLVGNRGGRSSIQGAAGGGSVATGTSDGTSVNGPAMSAANASGGSVAGSVNNVHASSGVVSVNGDGQSESLRTNDLQVAEGRKWMVQNMKQSFASTDMSWFIFFSGFFSAVLCFLFLYLLGRAYMY